MKFLILLLAVLATAAAFSLSDDYYDDYYHDLDDVIQHGEKGCNCVNGRCVTDSKGKTKCACRPGYALQDENTCEVCNCGGNGKCFFALEKTRNGTVAYQKKCLCDKGYAPKDGICVECVCGENTMCEFENGEKNCYCIEKYAEKDGVCTACDCGENGECKFVNGEKTCFCDQDYLVNNGKCEECYCGEQGTCSFVNGKKTCSCNKGYEDNGGYCDPCDCGTQGTCSYNNGQKVCSCFEGYEDKEGTCEECNCGKYSLGCRFDKTTKVCSCVDEYAELKGTCEECACGQHSSGCKFEGNSRDQKQCFCNEGYVQKGQNCEVGCGIYKSCENGGQCDGGFCKCLPGTRGEFCEIIDACVQGLCPNKRDSVCAYDVSKKEAYCKCNDVRFNYDPRAAQCKKSCAKAHCQNGGECESAGDSQFCKCLDGTSGDLCEVVDECSYKDFCGAGSWCYFDVDKAKASCSCVDKELSYDPRDKRCKFSCSEENKCENGGKCVQAGDATFCDCPEGTSGDLCQVVDDCVTGRQVCPNDAQCVFDPAKGKATCACNNPSKAYNSDLKVCKQTCDDLKRCNNGGECAKYDDVAFCKCPPGTSGDLCDIVDECMKDKHKCKDNSQCYFDVAKGKAGCRCLDPQKKYDDRKQKCIITCDNIKMCKNGGECVAYDGHQFCKCLPGTSGDLCEIVDECVKNRDMCKGDAECYYDIPTGDAKCKCDDPRKLYDSERERCIITCNQDTPCQNGGTCTANGGKFCKCVEGTSGDLCEIIDDCARGLCGFDKSVKCSFDSWNKVGRCGCWDESQKYDPVTQVCKHCNCGPNSVGCDFVNGNKVCRCPDAYADRNGLCQKVRCTDKCCVNGKCVIINGQEVCKCFEGYALDGDSYCRRLNCTNTICHMGECVVRYGNKEECVCPSGYSYYKGTCLKGNCRVDTCFGGRCETIDGERVCICPEGYSLKGIGCFATVCEKQPCYGGWCVVEDNKEVCYCHEGYHLVGNVCRLKFLCENTRCFGGICSVVKGKEVCTCPVGYSLHEDVCRRMG